MGDVLRNGPKTAPKAPKRTQIYLQESSKIVPTRPRGLHNGPKMSPKGSPKPLTPPLLARLFRYMLTSAPPPHTSHGHRFWMGCWGSARREESCWSAESNSRRQVCSPLSSYPDGTQARAVLLPRSDRSRPRNGAVEIPAARARRAAAARNRRWPARPSDTSAGLLAKRPPGERLPFQAPSARPPKSFWSSEPAAASRALMDTQASVPRSNPAAWTRMPAGRTPSSSPKSPQPRRC